MLFYLVHPVKFPPLHSDLFDLSDLEYRAFRTDPGIVYSIINNLRIVLKYIMLQRMKNLVLINNLNLESVNRMIIYNTEKL